MDLCGQLWMVTLPHIGALWPWISADSSGWSHSHTLGLCGHGEEGLLWTQGIQGVDWASGHCLHGDPAGCAVGS